MIPGDVTRKYAVKNTVGVSLPSPEDGNRSSFRNVVFLYLEFWTMEKVQIPSDPEQNYRVQLTN
jgi:hypothetical protein